MGILSSGAAIRRGAKWLVTGNLVGRSLDFAFGVVLARLLVPADFGMLVTMRIFTGLAGFVAGGGMGQALVQAKVVEKRDYDVVFTLQLLAGGLIYAFFFLIAPAFAHWFHADLYRDLLRVSALSFLIRPVGNVGQAHLHRAMRFRAIATRRMVTTPISGVVSIFLAWHHLGPWSLILGGLAGSLANAVLLMAASGWLPRPAFHLATAKRLGLYGGKVAANNLVSFLNGEAQNFVLSRLGGAALLGLYNKATSLQTLPGDVIGSSVYQTVFRALAMEQENRDRSRYLFFRAITLVAVYTWPFFVGLVWLADPFIVTVYGVKWQAAAAPLAILSLGGFVATVGMQAGALVAAQDRIGRELLIQSERIVWLVVACVVGLHWGLVGVAWATIPVRLYTSSRMYHLAASTVGTTFRDLVRALAPAIWLNTLLCGLFGVAHLLLFGPWREQSPALYLAGMAVVGVVGYLALFLFLPIEGLSSESGRWRTMLHVGARP